MIDCLTIPNFRALNTSVTAKQAELPFEMVQPWLEDEKLKHLVEDVSLRPYPTIKFKNGSFWIFRTAGKDGRFIRGMEFDRINYDEAGLDYGGETVKVFPRSFARCPLRRFAKNGENGRDYLADRCTLASESGSSAEIKTEKAPILLTSSL